MAGRKSNRIRMSAAAPIFAAALLAAPPADRAEAAPAAAATPASVPEGNRALAVNNEGVDLLGKGEIEKAIVLFTEARDLDPKNETVTGNLAIAYVKSAEALADGGKLEEAVNRLDQSLGCGARKQKIRDLQAATYNDIAALYRKKGDLDRAISLLETAVSLKPDSVVLRNNLGFALYKDNRREEAMREFSGVIADDPDNATARKMHGLLLYWKGRMKDALRELKTAARLNPGDAEVAGMVEKLEREYDIEKDFNVDDHVHFTVSFDGEKDYRLGSSVIDILEEAWLKVGNDLGLYPREKIAVVVYSNRDFRELTNKPKNIGGIYDGKIRIPVGGLERENDWDKLRDALFHEYTHVVVHFLSHGRCPLWLNEGIAEYESEEWDRRKEQIIARALEKGTFIPLAELSEALKNYGAPKRVTLAYCEALSVTRFIGDRYGVYNLRNLLNALDAGESLDEALSGTINLHISGLEEEWRRSLQE